VKTVGLRAEWGDKIGYGHLYRCLGLAEALREKGYNVVFFTKSKTESYLGRWQAVQLKSDGPSGEADALAEHRAMLVINDILDSDARYMRRLRERGIRSINLDDTGAGASFASANILSLRMSKKSEGNMITGLQYLILRKPFSDFRARHAKRAISDAICSVLIVASGSEPPEIIENCILWIKSYDPKVKVTLVSRSANDIKGLHDNLTAIKNAEASKLIDLMAGADIGVTGCGVSAYEMACTGLPVITICKSGFETSENQIGKYGFAIQIGQADSVKSKDMHAALELLADPEKRRIMSEKGYNAVDGSGLSRVVAIIEDMVNAG
jgi:spore coat polysaccharide biosynthesis predicted glycosyltransferase SpsG